ncbi:hypothetical protein JHK87_042815 [Glycine soja]|nr:hypothetical protein JHK87_042815 [Glycine soja]
MKSGYGDMLNMKVNIEWLILRLEEILEARKLLNQFAMLKGEKYVSKKIIESVKRELEQREAEKKALEKKETACKKSLARAQDKSTKIYETITNAKSKVRHFDNFSLADGLL